jgi:hypothetical protein
MKRLTFFFVSLLFFFVLVFNQQAHSQKILGAFSAGMNLTQVDGDEKYGFKKFGLNMGPSVILPFGKNKKWSVTMELLFSQLGARQPEQYSNDTPVDTTYTAYYDGYKLKLAYVQVPIMVHFTDKNLIAGGLGLLYGQLVDAKEWEDYNDSLGLAQTPTTLNSPYSMSDLQILADVRVRLYRKFWLNVRYSYSLFPIRERTYTSPLPPYPSENRKQYNNVITLRLTYIFNEVIIKNKKKESSNSEVW